jgi:hypothetical protein
VSSNSIALRLSGMFTLVALLVFLLIGGALYQQVDRGLGLLPEAELDARYSVLESTVNRYGTPEHWVKINNKLKLLGEETSASVSGWSAAIRTTNMAPTRRSAPSPKARRHARPATAGSSLSAESAAHRVAGQGPAPAAALHDRHRHRNVPRDPTPLLIA